MTTYVRGLRRRWLLIVVAFGLLLATGVVLAGLLWGEPVSAQAVLAGANVPSVPARIDGVLYVRRSLYELEGILPAGGSGPLTSTFEDWIDGQNPARGRQTIVDEPGGLRYEKVIAASGTVWEFTVAPGGQRSVERPAAAAEMLSELPTSLLARLANTYPDLLKEALAGSANLRYLGVQTMEPWGRVHRVAYSWDGLTAVTEKYGNRQHTITFNISDDRHWLVAWQDVVHAVEGDVVHRQYKLERWTVLPAAHADLFTFTPPPGVTVSKPSQELPASAAALPASSVEAKTSSTQAETSASLPPASAGVITVGDFSVERLPFRLWVPAYAPEGLRLTKLEIVPRMGGYWLVYRNPAPGGRGDVFITELPRLRYSWNGQPEIVDLPEAVVEVGSSAPGSGLSARVHFKAGANEPDIILSTSLSSDDLMQMIRSLKPVE